MRHLDRLMGMPRTTVLVAVVAAVFVPLTACSSGADPQDVSATSSTFTDDSTTPTTAAPNPSAVTRPSPGAVVSSDKVFNFVVPSGWNLTTNPDAVTYLSSALVAHDVAPTIVITRSKVSPAPALDKTLQMAMMQARQDGESVKRLPERSVGGEKAVAFTATSTEKNVAITRTYTMVAHERALYVVALTSAAADAGKQQSTLDSLLATLTWTKAGDGSSTASGTTPAAVATSTSTSTSPPSGSSSSSTSGTGGKPSSSTSASTASSTASSSAPSTNGTSKPTGSASTSR